MLAEWKELIANGHYWHCRTITKSLLYIEDKGRSDWFCKSCAGDEIKRNPRIVLALLSQEKL